MDTNRAISLKFKDVTAVITNSKGVTNEWLVNYGEKIKYRDVINITNKSFNMLKTLKTASTTKITGKKMIGANGIVCQVCPERIIFDGKTYEPKEFKRLTNAVISAVRKKAKNRKN